MQILKNGKAIKRTPMQFDCSVCGCVFIAEYGEYAELAGVENHIIITCKCPACGYDVQTMAVRKNWMDTIGVADHEITDTI